MVQEGHDDLCSLPPLKWSCARCTFINSDNTKECEICLLRRPDDTMNPADTHKGARPMEGIKGSEVDNISGNRTNTPKRGRNVPEGNLKSKKRPPTKPKVEVFAGNKLQQVHGRSSSKQRPGQTQHNGSPWNVGSKEQPENETFQQKGGASVGSDCEFDDDDDDDDDGDDDLNVSFHDYVGVGHIGEGGYSMELVPGHKSRCITDFNADSTVTLSIYYIRPLWTCPNGVIFLEAFSPIYQQVCLQCHFESPSITYLFGPISAILGL